MIQAQVVITQPHRKCDSQARVSNMETINKVTRNMFHLRECHASQLYRKIKRLPWRRVAVCCTSSISSEKKPMGELVCTNKMRQLHYENGRHTITTPQLLPGQMRLRSCTSLVIRRSTVPYNADKSKELRTPDTRVWVCKSPHLTTQAVHTPIKQFRRIATKMETLTSVRPLRYLPARGHA